MIDYLQRQWHSLVNQVGIQLGLQREHCARTCDVCDVSMLALQSSQESRKELTC